MPRSRLLTVGGTQNPFWNVRTFHRRLAIGYYSGYYRKALHSLLVGTTLGTSLRYVDDPDDAARLARRVQAWSQGASRRERMDDVGDGFDGDGFDGGGYDGGFYGGGSGGDGGGGGG